MTNRRVRIRIREVEVELEGPESFLEEHRHQWEPLLALAADMASDMDAALEPAPPAAAAESREAPVQEGVGEAPFADYGGALEDYDKVLVACYHAQQESEEHAFRWPDAARVAVRGGLSASDAAAEFQYLLDVRHVMRLKRGTYRVSAKGVESLHKLLAAAPPS